MNTKTWENHKEKCVCFKGYATTEVNVFFFERENSNNKFDMSIWIFLFIEWHFYSVCLNSHMRLHKIMQSIGAIEIANLKTFKIHQCLHKWDMLHKKNLQFFYVLFMWSKHNITGSKKNSIAAGGKECVTYEFNWWVCLQWYLQRNDKIGLF